MALVSFDQFSLAEGSPIYSQIIRFIKAGIVAGTIADGDEFPSRRALSALLGVNPNTIQKACRMLEEEGLLQSRMGAKSFIAVTEAEAEAIRVQLLEEDALALVQAIRRMGVSREEARCLLERLGVQDINELIGGAHGWEKM